MPLSGSRMTTEFGIPRSPKAHIGLPIGRSMEQSGTSICVSQTAIWASHPFPYEVKLDAGESVSAAGLIYRFDRERRHYYAFVAAGRDQFHFYSRDSSGFRTLYAGISHEAVNGNLNKLGIVAVGSLMQLYVNDVLVKKLEDESLREGDTGILGVGKGMFESDNFTIYR